MIKNYFYISLLILCLSTSSVLAQESKSTSRFQENTIEGLSVYPNPTNGDRIYITSKYNYDKDIVIFDVLGKKVLQTYMTSKELNISALTPGVYIIQVKENEIIATRKLIIK